MNRLSGRDGPWREERLPDEEPAEPAGGAAAAGELVNLSAALAGGEPRKVAEAVQRAAEGEAADRQVEEAILQSHLFLGFPAALAGLRAWRRVRGDAASAPEETEETGDGEAGRWSARGEEVCRRVYGEAYPKLRRNVRRLHSDLDRWMIRDGYGKVLGRPGLDLAARELCIVAVLAADARPEPLHSHLRGALRAGAAAEAVRRALERGLEESDDEGWRDRARGIWEDVSSRPLER